ncbi:hypothetical protein HDU96_010305 [Phlyctochytrium bullatum]|nr:hypothetical protein HDU96_010305 [Phlyctochytrium bullatum]
MPKMLPVELIQRILVLTNDLELAVTTELLLARFPHAIEPLLPESWNDMNESHFPASLAISRRIVVEPDGDLETTPAFRLAWVCEFRPDLITYKYVMRAAGAGRLDLIRILDAFEVPRFCMGTMDEAAAAGHLAVVKFLHYRRTEGCTSWAMTRAAKGGFLNVLRFLHANRTEGCRDLALIDAAVNGHFDVVSFLQSELLFFPDAVRDVEWPKIPTHHIRRPHEEFGWPVTDRVALDVMIRGTPEDFRFCLNHVSFPTRYSEPVDQAFLEGTRPWLENLKILSDVVGYNTGFWKTDYLDLLARHGHLEMLQFLYEKLCERCSLDGMRDAAENGHKQVFEFLVTTDINALSKIDDSIVYHAARGGSVELLRFLRTLDVPALVNVWTSDLTNEAHAHGRVAAVRYLAAELGLPVTLEVPECQHTFTYAVEDNRLDVLHFLHGNRSEEPSLDCLRRAVSKSLEVVKFLVAELGMRPDAETITEAASSGRIDLVKFLYAYLPPETPLNDAIGAAITHGKFETAKFLHTQRKATGPLRCQLWHRQTNLDVVTFAVETYLPQLDIASALLCVWSPYFHNIDVCKYVLESGHLTGQNYLFPWTTPHAGNLDLDCLAYGLKADMFDATVLPMGRVFASRQVCSLPFLRFLSHVAPQLFDAEVVATAITAARSRSCGVERVKFLLDRHPECVRWAEHLELAVTVNDMVVTMLLWERWPGGCPRKAMEAASRRGKAEMLKQFLKRMDAGNADWRNTVEACDELLKMSTEFKVSVSAEQVEETKPE